MEMIFIIQKSIKNTQHEAILISGVLQLCKTVPQRHIKVLFGRIALCFHQHMVLVFANSMLTLLNMSLAFLDCYISCVLPYIFPHLCI